MKRHHHHRYEILERVHHHLERHAAHALAVHGEGYGHGRRRNHRLFRLHHAWHAPGETHAAAFAHKPHKIDHTALRMHRDPPGPVKHVSTPQEVHEAIHKAAETFGVSPNVLGAIAYLESKGGDSNARLGSSLGLFQMQHATANRVMHRYGDKIAEVLEATDADKYKDIVGDLRAHRPPSDTHYNKMVLDPTFNALLGAGNTRQNATDFRIKPDLAHLTDLYSIHLSGRHIGADDPRTLTGIGMPDSYIRANAGVLGATAGNPDPTAAQAHAHMSGWLKGHLANFTAADKELGLYKEEPIEKPKPAAHAGHHAGHRHHATHHHPQHGM